MNASTVVEHNYQAVVTLLHCYTVTVTVVTMKAISMNIYATMTSKCLTELEILLSTSLY